MTPSQHAISQTHMDKLEDDELIAISRYANGHTFDADWQFWFTDVQEELENRGLYAPFKVSFISQDEYDELYN